MRTIRHDLLPVAGRLALIFLGFTIIWTGLGLLVTGPLAGTRLGVLDQHVATWLVQRRTPLLDQLSQIGSMLAQTHVKVVGTAVIVIVMLLVWRSWREPFLVGVALILEAAVFITVTWLVARPRPGVPPLDEVSVGTSFPSGHAAAAAAYAAIAIVVFERTRSTWIRAITVCLVAAVPVIVGISRMYRGVHYLTDAVGGVVLGAACVFAVYLIAPPRGFGGRRTWAGRPAAGVSRPNRDDR